MSMNSAFGRGWYNCSRRNPRRQQLPRYPGDVVGQEIHDAGQVIAGFHWDAMQDQIADYGSWGRYSTAWDWHWGRVLQHPMTQPAQVLATFIANDDDGNLANGTPQFNSYCLARDATTASPARSVTLPLAASGCDQYHQSPAGLHDEPARTTTGRRSRSRPRPATTRTCPSTRTATGPCSRRPPGTVGTDFVVGDFNHNATGVYQPYVSYGGTTTPYVTEWDSGAGCDHPRNGHLRLGRGRRR